MDCNDIHDGLLPVASRARRLLRHFPVYPPSVTIRRANRLRKRCSTGFAQPPGIISGGAFCTGTGTPTSGRCPGATGVGGGGGAFGSGGGASGGGGGVNGRID